MEKCYIFGAGQIDYPIEPPRGFVIAADGGYDALLRLGIKPDLLIGDLDSLSSSPPEGLYTLTFPVRKDYTDMHLAYLEGAKRGYTSFVIYGGTGGMPDHTFANYSLLLYGARQGHSIILADGVSCARVIENGEITLHGVKGKRLSVFAIGGDALGVTLQGAEYVAKDIKLSCDFPLGVSNAFTDCPCKISVKRGALLVISEN